MSRIVPQLPNNALTPDSINVVSTTGFSEGDLVYFNATNGNYGPIPNAAFSSAPFTISQQSSLYTGAAFNSFFGVHNPTDIGTYSTGRGSNNSEHSTAVLTNGNIVSVWSNRNTSRAWYQIKTAAGATVLAPTETTASFTVNGGLGPFVQVAALFGGGFVISFSVAESPQNLAYGVYNNAGAIVTAWQADSSFGTFTAGSCASIVALPNGNFVLASVNNSFNVVYRIYSANGTAAFPAVTAPVNTNVRNGNIGIAARSDSSFLLLYAVTNAQSLQYILVSATNTVITTASFTAGSNRNVFCDVTCLTNDTFVLAYIYQANTFQTPFIRLLPVGNTLGSEIPLSPTTTQLLRFQSGDTAFPINVRNLSSGGFVCAWVTVSGIIYYNFYNNLGVLVSGNASSNYARTIPAAGVQSYNCLNLIESGGNVIVSFSTYSAAFGSWLLFARINSSTYNLVVPNFITSVLGSAFVAAGNYIPSASTPTEASFLAAASASADVVIPLSGPSSFVLNPSAISATAVNTMDSATLTNGSFVIVTKDSTSPFTVTARIYAPTGGNIQTISVGNGISILYTARVAAMSDGGFVVSFATSNTTNAATITSNVYTNNGASFSLFSSSSFSNAYSFNSNYGLDVCGISNNRFVVYYPSGSSFQARFKVFGNDGATIFTSGELGNNNWIGGNITGSSVQSSEFIISGYWQGGGVGYASAFYESSTNTWSNSSNSSLPGGTSLNDASGLTLPNGTYILPSVQSSSGYACVVNSEGTMIYSGSIPYSTASTGGFTVGCTGFGSILAFADRNTTQGNQPTIYVFNPALWDGNASITGSSYIVNSATGMTFAAAPSLRVTPGVGYQAVLSWINSSSLPCYAIINAYPYSVNATITAGVSVSAGVPLSAQNGFILAGVAAQTVSAGASGNVTTNGSAVLNSNYSATTAAQAFDFQNPALFGVRGTIVGRNVNLQGNN